MKGFSACFGLALAFCCLSITARAQNAASSPESGAVCAERSLNSAATIIDQIKTAARAQAKAEAATAVPARFVQADDNNGWQDIGGGCWQKQDPNMPPGCYKKCCPYPVEYSYPCLHYKDGGCGRVGCYECDQYDYQHPTSTQQPGLSCTPTC